MALDCSNADSVLLSAEKAWSDHTDPTSLAPEMYRALALRLQQHGYITDGHDGLQILEHCRRKNLPIVDVLHALDARVRTAGYRGGILNLIDFTIRGREAYVFYDSRRFENSAAVTALLATLQSSVMAEPIRTLSGL